MNAKQILTQEGFTVCDTIEDYLKAIDQKIAKDKIVFLQESPNELSKNNRTIKFRGLTRFGTWYKERLKQALKETLPRTSTKYWAKAWAKKYSFHQDAGDFFTKTSGYASHYSP